METFTEFLTGVASHFLKLLFCALFMASLTFLIYWTVKGIKTANRRRRLYIQSIRRTQSQASEPIVHQCCSCSGQFEKGFLISEDKFCKTCLDNYRHYDYYRKMDIGDHQIYELTENPQEI